MKRLQFVFAVLFVVFVISQLSVGASIYIAQKIHLEDPSCLATILVQEAITIWDSAPATLERLFPLLAEENFPEDQRLRTKHHRYAVEATVWGGIWFSGCRRIDQILFIFPVRHRRT